MNDVLRLGIVGGGWPGRMHAAAFSKIEGVELAAAADAETSILNGMLEQFSFGKGYTSYTDLLQHPGLDAVVLTLPTWLHAEATEAALDAGLHVLCEKPPTVNLAEMAKIKTAAGLTGKTYMFCRQTRFSQGVQAARRCMEEGQIGTVAHAQTRWLRAHSATGNDTWRSRRSRGGGVLLDLGIHAIDNAWYPLGCPEPVEVTACNYTQFADAGIAEEGDAAEDSAFGFIRFRDDLTMAVAVSFFLHLDVPALKKNPEKVECILFGKNGSVDTLGGDLIRFGSAGAERIRLWEGDASDSFHLQALEFVNAIREEREPISSATQALTLMKIIDAWHRSSKERKSITLSKVTLDW